MRSGNRPSFILLAGAAVAALTSVSWAQDSGPASRRGERLVEARCAICHATGTATVSPNPVAPPMRTILRRYPAESLIESLQEGLTSGHPQMPTFRFSAGEAGAILSYLESIQAR